jgi:hypothetical protein
MEIRKVETEVLEALASNELSEIHRFKRSRI